MGVRSAVRSLVGSTKAPAEAKGGAHQTAFSMPFTRQPVRKPNILMLRTWAETNEWVRAAINVRRLQISQTQYDIVPIDPSQPIDETLRQQIYMLFAKPNTKRESFRTLIEPVVEDILVLDSGCIEKQQNAKSIPVHLWNVDPQWMRVSPTWDGSDPEESRYFWYPMGSWKASFTNDEILYIMANPATYRVLGLSPLEVLRETVEADLAASRYNREMVQGAPPAGLIDLGEGITAEQVHQFRFYFDNEIAGRKSLGVIGGSSKAQFIPFAQNNREMQFMQWQIYLVRKICAVFGISAQDLNLTFDINRATAETQLTMTEDRGLKPLLSLIEEYMNREIVADFIHDDVKKRFVQGSITAHEKTMLLALSLVNPRQQREVAKRLGGVDSVTNLMFEFAPLSVRSYDKQAEINTGALGGLPWMTPNEARSESNLPPLPGDLGDKIYVMTNLGPIALDEVAGQVPPSSEAAKAMIEHLHRLDPIQLFTVPDRKALGPPRPKSLPSPDSTKGRLRAKTEEYFQALASSLPVDDIVRAAFDASAEKVSDVVSDALWRFQISADSAPRRQDFADALFDAAVESYNRAGQQALHTLHSALSSKAAPVASFNLVNQAVLQDLRANAFQSSSLQLEDSTRNALRQTITSGLRDGNGIDVLSSKMRRTMNDWSGARARTIANTEVNTSMSRASHDTYSRNGVKEMEWMTTASKPCDVCQTNESHGPVKVDDAFPSGSSTPPAHPDCECTLVPVIPDDWTMDNFKDPWNGRDDNYEGLGIDGCFSGKSVTIVRAPKKKGEECGFDGVYAEKDRNESLRKRIGTYIQNVGEFKKGALSVGPFVKARDDIVSWMNDIATDGGQQLRAGAGKYFGVNMENEYGYAREAATAQEAKLAETMYLDTQAFLRAEGITEIKVYRGIQGQLAEDIQSQLEYYPGDPIRVDHNVLSSYSTSREIAEQFASAVDGAGVVVEMTVPAGEVFALPDAFLGGAEGLEFQREVITVNTKWRKFDPDQVTVVQKVEFEPFSKAAPAPKKMGSTDEDTMNREWSHFSHARGYDRAAA